MPVFETEVSAVIDRRDHYKTAEDYYEGTIPEIFSSAKLRAAMRALNDGGKLNYCRPVVDAVNNRMEISSITGTTKAATTKIDEIWVRNELDLEAKEIHRRALTFGDAYAMVWPDSNGDLQVAYNSPLTTTIIYDPENPRKKQKAVKIWAVDPQNTRMNIYTEDVVYKYRAGRPDSITAKTEWIELDSEENPFGEIPVFHFRTHRPSGRPEHVDGYDAQNAINKLFITNMYTVDYLGAPQRWALASAGSETEIEDFKEGEPDRANMKGLKAGPGEMWYLQGVAAIGQFPAADPQAFWTPIMNIVRSMASLTDTPLHYFEKTQTPSGNALRVAEAPLLKKISDRQASFAQTWRELFRFALKVENIKSDVQVFWKALESLDELERWDVILKKINSGLSHRQALREMGYDEEKIQQIMEERMQELQEGLYYQRANGTQDRVPQTRVNTSNDETQAIQPEGN